MSLKVRAILVVVIGVVMGLSLSVGGGLLGGSGPEINSALTREQAQLFAEVLERVKRDYVDVVDDAELLESALRGMISHLDVHSEYLDASEYRDIRSSTTGSYTGVGLEVAMIDGVIRVITPIAGSPAARSGIRSGDELIAVDGRSIKANRLREALGQLRGYAGSTVTLTVLRDSVAIDHEMRRQIIRVASVHRELLNPWTGYVRVSQFNEGTARELSGAVDELQEMSSGTIKGLILDLRNNPGGVLESAVEVADLFMDSGIIVTASGRSPESQFTRTAQPGDILDGAALIVLVNSGSASASEIAAGALQDHGRAIIVGTSTFGKGLVQTVIPLSKGRAIKLTTSRYYTPSGDSIHNVGIAPDVVVDDTPGFPDLSLSGIVDREADAQLVAAMGLLQPRIAIIIDDLGYGLAAGQRAIDLPGPIALAVLPGAPRTAVLAERAHERGKEVLLHLPLQAAADSAARDPVGIVLDMSRREFGDVFAQALMSVPHAIGVNSHRGSLLTRLPGHMLWLMEEIHARDELFFVDSYTTHESVALQLAEEVGVSARKRDIFLDPDRAPETVVREFERMKKFALRHGSVIAIGHPYAATLALLERELPKLEAEGFELVTISDLVNGK